MILRAKAYTADEMDAVDGRIRATCHPLQAWFVFDAHRYVSLLTGRGGGKTTGALMRCIRRMVRHSDSNCLFIAATRESAERLVWQDLKRVLERLRIGAKWSEAKLTCTLRNGSTLRLFGCDDKRDINKLRGITYHAVVVDEVASINKELLRELLDEVIGPRMVGSLCLIGTPGKELSGIFYDATRPGSKWHRPYKDRDAKDQNGEPLYGECKWSSHAWTVHDGAAHGIAPMLQFLQVANDNKRENGWSDTNPYWLREYMGQWIADESASVYAFRPYEADGNTMFNLWDPKRDHFGLAVLPEGVKDWASVICIDLGWKDATAIETFSFSFSHPSRRLYHRHEVYSPRMYARSIAQTLIGERLDVARPAGIIGALGAWPVALVGDFSRSGHALLKELGEVYGITVVPIDKPYAYKNNSIELTNSALFEQQIVILKGSGIEREMTTLQWVVDQYGKRTEAPGMDNHGSDCVIGARDAIASMLPPVAIKPAAELDVNASDPEFRRRPVMHGDADSMYDADALAG